MTNKNYNNMAKRTGNDVHKMPITKTDDVKNATTRNINTTRTSPQSDTTAVPVTRDALTQALYGRDK